MSSEENSRMACRRYPANTERSPNVRFGFPERYRNQKLTFYFRKELYWRTKNEPQKNNVLGTKN